MALDQLEDVVRAFDRHRSSARDQAGDLRGRSRAAQDAGGSGDVTREIENAVRILERQADELDRMRRDLRSRIERARSLLEAPSLSFSAVITGIASALRDMFGGGSGGRSLDQAGKRVRPSGAPPSKSTSGSPMAGADLLTRPAEWFQTQMGSRYVNGVLDTSSGGNNCGPASLSMVITYWRLRGATRTNQPITPLEAANEVRGGPDRNGPSNETTDFGLAGYAESKEARELLDRYGLELGPISTLDDVRSQLSHGDPVILLVQNSKYRDEDPYGKGASEGFFGYWEKREDGTLVWNDSNHIIVVTRLDGETVRISDPLAKGPIDIPLSKLVDAANAASSVGHWYGAGVRPSTHEAQVAQPLQNASTPTGQRPPQSTDDAFDPVVTPDLSSAPVAGSSGTLRPRNH